MTSYNQICHHCGKDYSVPSHSANYHCQRARQNRLNCKCEGRQKELQDAQEWREKQERERNAHQERITEFLSQDPEQILADADFTVAQQEAIIMAIKIITGDTSDVF